MAYACHLMYVRLSVLKSVKMTEWDQASFWAQTLYSHFILPRVPQNVHLFTF